MLAPAGQCESIGNFVKAGKSHSGQVRNLSDDRREYDKSRQTRQEIKESDDVEEWIEV